MLSENDPSDANQSTATSFLTVQSTYQNDYDVGALYSNEPINVRHIHDAPIFKLSSNYNEASLG